MKKKRILFSILALSIVLSAPIFAGNKTADEPSAVQVSLEEARENLERVRVLMTKGGCREMIPFLQDALTCDDLEDEERAEALVNLGGLLVQFQKYEEANSYLTDAFFKRAHLSPFYQHRMFRYLGDVAVFQKKYEVAIKHHAKSLELFAPQQLPPAFVYANAAIGECYMHLKDYDKAIAFFEKTLPYDMPKSMGRIYYLLGFAYKSLSRHDRALACYQRAQNYSNYLGKDTVELEIFRCYAALNDIENAQLLLSKVQTFLAQGEMTKSKLSLLEAVLDMGSKAYQKALVADSDEQKEAFYERACTFFEAFYAYHRFYEENFYFFYDYTWSLMYLNRMEEALEVAGKAQPYMKTTEHYLAVAASQKIAHDFLAEDEGEEEHQHAANKVYFMMGNNAFSASNNEAAIACYKKSLEEDTLSASDEAEVNFRIAMAYFNLKQHSEAVPFLKAMLEVEGLGEHSLLIAAKNALGRCAVVAGDDETALAYYTQVRTERFKDAQIERDIAHFRDIAVVRAAECLFDLGRYAEAKKLLKNRHRLSLKPEDKKIADQLFKDCQHPEKIIARKAKEVAEAKRTQEKAERRAAEALERAEQEVADEAKREKAAKKRQAKRQRRRDKGKEKVVEGSPKPTDPPKAKKQNKGKGVLGAVHAVKTTVERKVAQTVSHVVSPVEWATRFSSRYAAGHHIGTAPKRRHIKLQREAPLTSREVALAEAAKWRAAHQSSSDEGSVPYEVQYMGHLEAQAEVHKQGNEKLDKAFCRILEGVTQNPENPGHKHKVLQNGDWEGIHTVRLTDGDRMAYIVQGHTIHIIWIGGHIDGNTPLPFAKKKIAALLAPLPAPLFE